MAIAASSERAGAAPRLSLVPRRGRARLLIVGNGMVGQRLCERLVELGAARRYEIRVLGEETMPAYDRVHLSDIFRGRSPAELVLRPPVWFSDSGIELNLAERAIDVVLAERCVHTATGKSFEYDKLVLATGSTATMPRIEVGEGAEIVPYRTLEDARRVFGKIAEREERRTPVVVIGGGLLGVEAARAFQLLRCNVMVFEASSQLMPRQLDPAASAALRDRLVAAGIQVRTKCTISAIERDGSALRITLSNGELLRASVVMAAAGVRPNDALARAAGLRCHPRGGVEVDARLRTSAPDVFAVGECAHHANVPHGLVAPGYAMADVLAENLVGQRRRLAPQSAVTRLKLDLAEVTVLGDPLMVRRDADLVFSSAEGYRHLVIEKRRVVAAIAIGAWDELASLQTAFAARRRLKNAALAKFQREGRLGLAEAAPRLNVLSDSAIVCQCANVDAGRLRQAIAAGARDVDTLSRMTGAGSLCGSCRPALAVLCGGKAEKEPVQRLLRGAGAVALAAAFATLVLPRFPVAKSVLDEGLDLLFKSTSLKQASGFGLVAFLLFGMTFSARKRVAWFHISSYRTLRVLHGLLGMFAVIGLFFHTGFRLGANLNLALMLVFLTSATTGALAALATNLKHRNAQALATFCRRTHEITFWPLPALAAFHALKTYYF